MTASTVNGRNGCCARAGARTLNLLAAPFNAAILESLGQGPRRLADLRRITGQPAQSTLRSQLKKIASIGAIEKQRCDGFPGALEYELTDAGRELLRVASLLDTWLKRCPDESLTLGGGPAKAVVRSLTEGWSTTMLRALAAKPLTLTELDRLIATLSYPSLERRLASLRLAGIVAERPGRLRGTPYAMTDWGRLCVGPLLAAAHWEHCHLPTSAPSIAALDIETVFLLAATLIRLPASDAGTCRLAVELGDGGTAGCAGVAVDIREGELASCTTRLEGDATAWIIGGQTAWFTAMIEGNPPDLEIGGDTAFARKLIEGLHTALVEILVAD